MIVEFVTLGDASSRLDVPAPTLRNWTEQLEEYGVHYVERNNRNERMYYDSDMKIFAFLRDLKKEYGRRTTTRDLANMIAVKGQEGEFELRGQTQVPESHPSNRTSELMNHEDIKRLMDSDRVKQFLSVAIKESIEDDRRELLNEIETLMKQNAELQEQLNEKNIREVSTVLEEQREEQAEFMNQINEKIENSAKKGFWSSLFGK